MINIKIVALLSDVNKKKSKIEIVIKEKKGYIKKLIALSLTIFASSTSINFDIFDLFEDCFCFCLSLPIDF